MEVPESLFARLEDDIIVHIASALPLNDASNFMVTCKRTHTLANTRIDTWWNWVGATAALEEEFPLPESYTNEEEDQPLTPWRLRNDPRADANAWGLLSPRERVAKLIQLGQAMTNRIRRAALDVADYWWDGYRFYDLKDQKKLKALRANACRFKLATELSTLYAFEDEVGSSPTTRRTLSCATRAQVGQADQADAITTSIHSWAARSLRRRRSSGTMSCSSDGHEACRHSRVAAIGSTQPMHSSRSAARPRCASSSVRP